MTAYTCAMQLRKHEVNLGGDGTDAILRLNFSWEVDSVPVAELEPVFKAGDTVDYKLKSDDNFPSGVKVDLYFTSGKPLIDTTDGRNVQLETKTTTVALKGGQQELVFGPFTVADNYTGIFQFNVWATDVALVLPEQLPSFASLDPEMIVGD